MIINYLVLLASALLGGIIALFFGKIPKNRYDLFLVFAGSYLFSVTLVHILPELFSLGIRPVRIGIFVLAGFFFQQVLEYFSSGIEHGHIHTHHRSVTSGFTLVVALCIHALLEGSLLAHPETLVHHHGNSALLIGISIHKIPAAFALIAVLQASFPKRTVLLSFFVFTISSPLGLLLSNSALVNGIIASDAFYVIYAIVAGSFLHISTTIVFESSPEHRFNGSRLLVALLGAGAGIIAELLF